MKTHHKGASRRYWCPRFLDENGKVLDKSPDAVPTMQYGTHPLGCWTGILKDGDAIHVCPGHWEFVKTARFKRVEERRIEAMERAQVHINGTYYWSDIAVRKSRCNLCHGDIVRGEHRIAFDSGPMGGRLAFKTQAGGVITRTRAYVHAACFTDVIYGGRPGEGCPGCSAKILHDEFMQVRDMLVKREHGDG